MTGGVEPAAPAEEYYRHTPLTADDSIRVLDLLPALDAGAPVRCRLREVKLARAGGRYAALSYVWGSPSPSSSPAGAWATVTCAGRRLPVTPNCHGALVHLRSRLRPRALWIDALCIDQGPGPASARERRRQVALMGAIYRAAARVLIWLGPADPQTARVFRLFRDLYRCRIELPRAQGRCKPVYRLVREVYEQAEVKNCPAFTRILENPWLTRVWTVQEVALARQAVVTMGHHRISWRAYAHALNFTTQTQYGIARPNLIRPRLGAAYIGGADAGGRGDRMENLVDLLHCIQHLECQLAHDRVFGLYSVLTRGGLRLSAPDYRRPVSHVFQELVVAFVGATGSVAPLWMTLPAPAAAGLPSWVPNWLAAAPGRRGLDESGTFTLLSPRALVRGQQASRASVAAAAHDMASGRLRLRARRVAKILCRVSPIPEGAEDGHSADPDAFAALCEKYCQYIRMTKGDASVGVLRELVRCVYARSSDRHLAGWFHMMLYPGGDGDEAAEELLRPVPGLIVAPPPPPPPPAAPTSGDGEDDDDDNDDDDDDNEAAAAAAASGDYLPGLRAKYAGWPRARVAKDLAACRDAYQRHVGVGARYAFVTLADGRLGRAHHSCRRGDDVFLVAGSHMPLVLRAAGAAFRVVAPAYVAGVMRGELWPDDDDDGAALETITLV